MSYQIKENDSFFAIISILKMAKTDFQKKISESFKQNKIEIENEDLTLSIWEVLSLAEIELQDFVSKTFPSQKNNSEFLQIFPHLIIWGEGSEFPCENCGSEMDIEEDGWGNTTWNEYKCSVCGCESSGEPDWDTMPGGKDF